MTYTTFPEKLAALRNEIEAAGFEGFLVPMSDEYQNEYVPPCARRIEYLSGFTGSAAHIVVLKDKAAFFTDGRYVLQAEKQIPIGLYFLFDTADKTPTAWMEENLSKGMIVAYDPWLHSAESIERLRRSLAKIGASAAPIARNLVDIIWESRPLPPHGKVAPYPMEYAGKSSEEKRKEIAASLKTDGACAAIINDPSSVAWLLNIRGDDIENTPIPLSRAILKEDASAIWFVDPYKIDPSTTTHIVNGVTISSPDNFPAALEDLAKEKRPIRIDPAASPGWIMDYLQATRAVVDAGRDPCYLPRAIKNATELSGIKKAHIRDGAALTRFLAWLDNNWRSQNLTEIDAEEKLESFRKQDPLYQGASFDTISSAGENGAIVHYRATKESNAKLKDGQIYLVDSGGQYLDGTTDVTRTVALGVPTQEMKDRFTRVLKGHVALAKARFPEGTSGSGLDVLARQYLWDAGLDYNHGTGHGVGCYLSVHEGPQSISKSNREPLRPGMVLSNEPGYYKPGHFGIRIENLQVVVETASPQGSEHKMLGFETLTLAPIDRNLIDVKMLSNDEIVWINAYHKRVFTTLESSLDTETVEWLKNATAPI